MCMTTDIFSYFFSLSLIRRGMYEVYVYRNRAADWLPLRACSIHEHSGPRQYFLPAAHNHGQTEVEQGNQTYGLDNRRPARNSSLRHR